MNEYDMMRAKLVNPESGFPAILFDQDVSIKSRVVKSYLTNYLKPKHLRREDVRRGLFIQGAAKGFQTRMALAVTVVKKLWLAKRIISAHFTTFSDLIVDSVAMLTGGIDYTRSKYEKCKEVHMLVLAGLGGKQQTLSEKTGIIMSSLMSYRYLQGKPTIVVTSRSLNLTDVHKLFKKEVGEEVQIWLKLMCAEVKIDGEL